MFDIWFWFWVTLTAFLLVAEIFTAGFFMLPFGAGAGVAALLNYLDASLAVQWIGFLTVSVLLFISIRGVVDRITHEPPIKTGANRLVGKTGLVITELVPNSSVGQVRIEREEWKADAPGLPVIPVGTPVTVIAVEGTHLVVKPADQD
ncbi:MAG: NfeD family protein [Actinomycetota bacterium]|nr:NfeD family protein [Actinomycetota bacterium]